MLFACKFFFILFYLYGGLYLCEKKRKKRHLNCPHNSFKLFWNGFVSTKTIHQNGHETRLAVLSQLVSAVYAKILLSIMMSVYAC